MRDPRAAFTTAFCALFFGCGGGVSAPGSTPDDGGVNLVASETGTEAGSAESGPDVEEIGVDEACGSYLGEFCTLLATCAPFTMEWYFGGRHECAAAEHFLCTARLRAPGNVATTSSLVSCAHALRAMTCDEFNYSETVPAGCETAPGTLPKGSACGADQQCATAYCSHLASDSTLCGVCADKSPPDGICRSTSDCTAGFSCLAGRCRKAAEGQFCLDDAGCPANFRCLGRTDTSKTGTCGKPLGLGEPCEPNYDACDFWIVGLVCDPEMHACRKRTVVDAGQTCAGADGFSADCRGGRLCNRGPTCSGGVPIGGACTASDDCASWATCWKGVCTAPDPALCQ